MSLTKRCRSTLYWAPLCALVLTGCFTPPVHDSVLLVIEGDGSVRLRVETVFTRQKDQGWKERDQIQRVVDAYLLGRDPWLRGLERIQAREVTHELRGGQSSPEKIERDAMLPSVTSLEEVMPDAIANFALIVDDEDDLATLRIIHIDLPESMRDGWRRLERESRPLSTLLFDLAGRQCDLYDYLAEAPKRRRDVATALSDPDHFEGMLTPDETLLLEMLRRMEGRFEAYWDDPTWGTQGPQMAGMRFSAFDHDFCVRIPSEAIEAVGFIAASPERDDGGDHEATGNENLYCAESYDIEGLLKRMQSGMDPPMRMIEFPEGLQRIEEAPFTCERPGGPEEVEAKLWALMLPRPRYFLSWKAATVSRAAF